MVFSTEDIRTLAPSPSLSASPTAGASECPLSRSFDNDVSSQSSASALLVHSSPLTDGDVNGDTHGDAQSVQDKNEGTQKPDATRTPPQSPSPPSSTFVAESSENLGDVLRGLDLLCRGKHPDLTTHREHFEFTLSPSEYDRLRRFLEQPQVDLPSLDQELDLNLPIDFHSWVHRLRIEYSPSRSRLTVRMLTPVHQYVAKELENLLIERFNIALEKTGRGGKIVPLVGVERHFWEPQREFIPRPPVKQRIIPRRSQSRQDAAQEPELQQTLDSEGGSSQNATAEVVDQGDASSEANSVVEAMETRCPDLGLVYVPPESKQDYFPGFILEVGYSHQLQESQAKQYIRESQGYVRYVMAFNLDYDVARKKRQTSRNVTFDGYHVVCADDTWFPEQCLKNYNVRANLDMTAAAETPNNQPAETDIGLRLSHLHETLSGDDIGDVPITLPLQRLLSMVEEAFEEQSQHDRLKSKPDILQPPKWLRGKRVRTATPPEEQDELVGRNPDANYIDSSHSRTSSKRRRTEKTKD